MSGMVVKRRTPEPDAQGSSVWRCVVEQGGYRQLLFFFRCTVGGCFRCSVIRAGYLMGLAVIVGSTQNAAGLSPSM